MKKVMVLTLVFFVFLVLLVAAPTAQAASSAAKVVSYNAGNNPASDWASGLDYDISRSALGTPDDITGEGTQYLNVLGPFSAAYERGEIVSIGEGGHLTLQLARYVEVAAGLDLGVVTNVNAMDSSYPNGQATNPAILFGVDSANVEVSADGQSWVSLGSKSFNMPANYYVNAGPYDTTAPSTPQLADFGKTFAPGGMSAFDGKNNSQIVSLMNGSGGGTWLDLSSTGLSKVGYVRFSVVDDGDANVWQNFEVDSVVIANEKVGQAQTIQVGTGSSTASFYLEFKGGISYDFEVSFDGEITGKDLFDIIEQETLLSSTWAYGGAFLDGVNFDDNENAGFGGGEDWWHYWNKDGQGDWTAALGGAGARIIQDGYSDGWIYGSASAPNLPEPATMSLMVMGLAALLARRKKNA